MYATCNDCGQAWSGDQLNQIRDLQEHVRPGDIMPAGKCPDCRGLCYVERQPCQIVIKIGGGRVQGVFCDNAADLDVIVVDCDQRGVAADDSKEDQWATTVDDQRVRAYPPTIHYLSAMDPVLRAAVQHVDAMTGW